jgi:hypothetical protein
MIWMGVVGPADWDALVNRFPTHYQSLMALLKARFVTDSSRDSWKLLERVEEWLSGIGF